MPRERQGFEVDEHEEERERAEGEEPGEGRAGGAGGWHDCDDGGRVCPEGTGEKERYCCKAKVDDAGADERRPPLYNNTWSGNRTRSRTKTCRDVSVDILQWRNANIYLHA